MRTIVGILLVFLGTASLAHADFSPAFIKKLSRMPGVTKKTSFDGKSQVTTWEKAGVTITRIKGRGIVINDSSGKGAVYCSRSIYIMIKYAIDVCSIGADQSIKDELDGDIRSIDDFIVKNSLEPVRLGKLRFDEAKQFADGAKAFSAKSPDEVASLCRADGFAGKLVAYVRNQTSTQRKQALDTLLSIPRWPALNPCM